DEPLFHVPAYKLVSPGEFGVYAVLGVVGGLFSVAFVKLLLRLRAWFATLPESTVWLQPAIGGLTVGLLGYFVPQVLGVGYDQVDTILNGDVVLKFVLMMAVLKIIATAVCYASGNAGGIFGPSMFIGAMVGAAVGSVAHGLFPASTASPGAYALVGMGTAFAGIIRTPLTSVIMIFEVTRDYTIIVPLMISNMIAFFISQRLQKEPIYEALAHQDGIHLPTSEFRAKSARLNVTIAIREPPEPIAPETPVVEAIARIQGSSLESWPVADDGGLVGMIRVSDLEAEGVDPAQSVKDVLDHVRSSATAEDLNPHVHPDQPLGQTLAKMGESGHRVLPVVSRANARILLGIVTLADVLKAYGVANRTKSDASVLSADD
ncbi:MAG: chloride channel protein, partial [Gemmatimonadota bacterium]|nr:chloride channel protein [Gemmatimonadota bacterium]